MKRVVTVYRIFFMLTIFLLLKCEKQINNSNIENSNKFKEFSDSDPFDFTFATQKIHKFLIEDQSIKSMIENYYKKKQPLEIQSKFHYKVDIY